MDPENPIERAIYNNQLLNAPSLAGSPNDSLTYFMDYNSLFLFISCAVRILFETSNPLERCVDRFDGDHGVVVR